MKTNTKISLINIAGVLGLGALILYAKKKCDGSITGIGAAKKPKRRIWVEVARAQESGVDFTDPTAWQQHAQLLRKMSKGVLSETSASAKPVEQRYFNQLRRAYNSIAGTTLPFKESVIRNEHGDVILVYHDYNLDQLATKAAEFVKTYRANYSGEIGYWYTIADIALGKLKFVWNSKAPHRGVQQLVFGQNVPEERKQRISYLATPEKGGVYPEAYAHYLWESVTDGRGDDQEITDGVLDAIREITSVGQAQQLCIEKYLKAHQVEEQPLWQDVPF